MSVTNIFHFVRTKCFSCVVLTHYQTTSNFSFSHHVFHSYISLVHQNAALCGNGINNRTWHLNLLISSVRNGAERSGLFCVLSIIMERLKTEQRINLPQVILQLRARRPQLISSLVSNCLPAKPSGVLKIM